MNYLLLAVSVLLGTGKNIFSKFSTGGGLNRLFCTNIITSLVAMTVFGSTGIDTRIFSSPKAILLALLYGIFTMLSQMLFIKAVEYSPTGVCSLIYSMGFIIPAMFSVVYFAEPFGIMKAVGILLMIISFILVSGMKSGRTSRLYFAFAAMTASGIIGIIQKFIGKSSIEPSIPNTTYLFFAFAVMLVLSFIGYLLTCSKKEKRDRRFFAVSLMIGVCVSFANLLNLRLAGSLPGVVFFTCVNGGVIILSAIASRVIFREKASRLQLIGILVGILSIVSLVI